MLYHLLYPLKAKVSAFNLFRYITFRAAYAAVTALIISFILGPWLIGKLKALHVGEKIREDGPKTHEKKRGTPTMGGILIFICLLVPLLLWADLTNRFIQTILLASVWLAGVGFFDDYLKLKQGKGLGGRHKILAQALLGAVVGLLLTLYPAKEGYGNMTSLLFLKNTFVDFGPFYIPFVILVVVGASNAVNLTDGLDGLAIGIVAIAGATYAALSYAVGHSKIAGYLNVLFINGTGELTVFCLALVGASVGFLWFNAHPAQVFMGDTGSLLLGGTIGLVAVMIKQEILLLVVGGVFVIEALSVILQVLYFRKTKGRRLFKMVPLHHHFELMGWKESKVVVRFWILAVLFGLLALSTLKIR